MPRLIALLLASLLALVAPLAHAARGLQFSETMAGYVYYGGEHRNASVQLVITISDIDAWSANLNVPATVKGTLFVDRLPSQPVTGTLVILAPAPGDDGRLLSYQLNGTAQQLTGVKHVHDQAPTEVFDDMTTLHAVLLDKGKVPPSTSSLLYDATWTCELHFAWWDPVNVASFVASFTTINTPWWQVWDVEAIFVSTMFGALANTLFPWLV